MTIRDFIGRNPVLCYFALAMIITSGSVLVAIAFTGMPATKEQMEAMLPVAIMATLLGPSLSGLFMIGLLDGKAGLRELKTRLFKWRVGLGWYAVALFLAPVFLMAVLLGLSLFSPDYVPGIFTRDDKMARLMLGLFSGIMVGICEEIGWTGFAAPHLRKRYSALNTGLIIGLMWGIWHIVPMAILPAVAYSGDISPGVYVAVRSLNFIIGGLVAFRVMMVWVYDRTHSLLIMILMHIGLTAVNIIYEPRGIAGISNFVYDFVSAAVEWLIVAVILIANKGRLSVRPGNLRTNTGAGDTA